MNRLTDEWMDKETEQHTTLHFIGPFSLLCQETNKTKEGIHIHREQENINKQIKQ